MQNNKDEKERKLSQAFLNPTVERLKRWIEQINNDSLGNFPLSVANELNKKRDSADECLNAINGYYEGFYDYVDFQGNYAFSKVRLIPKSFIFGRFEGNMFKYGLGKHRKEITAIYGDLKAIRKAIADGGFIILCEGEKDIVNLKERGYSAAFCVGSCKDWLPDYAELVKGGNLTVIADYDDPGFTFAKSVITDCLPVAKSVRVCYFPLFKGADLSDWLDSGGTVKGLLGKIKNAPPLESGVI